MKTYLVNCFLLEFIVLLCIGLVPAFFAADGDHKTQSTSSQTCGSQTVPSDETDLLACLFSSGYDPMARPVKKVNDVINVTLNVYPMKIVDVVEKDHIFMVKGWIMMKWKDEKLTWKPEEYNGLQRLWVDAHKVWKPDIMVYNYAEDMYEVMLETPVHVMNNGDVHWSPNNALIKAYCNIDLTWFPFDTQKCSLVFGSFSNDLSQVDIYSPSDKNSSKILPYDGKEWNVIDLDWTRRVFTWGGVVQYPAIVFTLTMQREPTYYRHLYIIPAFFLTLFTLLIFIVPADTQYGHRLILGCALLITNTLLTGTVENHLPTQLGSLPHILSYLTFQQVTLFFIVLYTVIVMNIVERVDGKTKLPQFLRTIFLGKLSRVCCVPTERYVSVPMSGSDGDAGGTGAPDGLDFQALNPPPPAELRVTANAGAEPYTPPSSMEKTMEDIRRYLHVLSSRDQGVSADKGAGGGVYRSYNESVYGEWMQFVAVLDRLFALIYSFFIVMLAVILLSRG